MSQSVTFQGLRPLDGDGKYRGIFVPDTAGDRITDIITRELPDCDFKLRADGHDLIFVNEGPDMSDSKIDEIHRIVRHFVFDKDYSNPAPSEICDALAKDGTLDGTNQYFSHADNAFLDFSGGSMSGGIWVKQDVAAAEVIWAQFAGGGQFAWELSILANPNRFQWRISNDGSALKAITIACTSTNWNYVHFYHDNGTDIGISIDAGDFSSTAHTTGMHNSTTDMTLGVRPGDAYLAGKIRAWWLSKSLYKTRSGFHNAGTALAGCELASAESNVLDGTTAEGVYHNMEDLTVAIGGTNMGSLTNNNSATFDAF